jgi:hypothetical protein
MAITYTNNQLFRFLKNIGGPTQWDSGNYPDYRKKMSDRFSKDMLQIVDYKKVAPTLSKSFWFASLVSVEYSESQLKFVFISDSEEWEFQFIYSDLLKVRGMVLLTSELEMVIQELTLLKNGVIRHAFSEYGGNGFVVYAKEIKYYEKKLTPNSGPE